jgi:hypothetical protein
MPRRSRGPSDGDDSAKAVASPQAEGVIRCESPRAGFGLTVIQKGG